jgi:hypothetical protein
MTESDIPHILPLLQEMHETSPLKLPPLSLPKVEATLRNCLRDGVVFLAPRYEGILALRHCAFWYSDATFLADQVFYVSVHHRKSRHALRLLCAAKAYAKMRNLPLLMATSHGGDVERKNNFYQRSGMRLIGGVFERGL